MPSAGEFYSRFAQAYDRVMSAMPVYLELLDMHKRALKGRRRILDSGCGSGRLALAMLEQGSEVYAVDESAVALNMLKQRAKPYRQLKTYCRDAHSLPFGDEFFDGISSMLVLPFVDAEKYLREHARVLKKGGVLAVSGPSEGAKDADWVLSRQKENLRACGLLEGLQEHLYVFDMLKQSAQSLIRNWFSAEEVSRMLDSEGLTVIDEQPNPVFFGKGYFIVAEKDEPPRREGREAFFVV